MPKRSHNSPKRTQARFIARVVPGSKPSEQMPGFVVPQLATLRDEVPSGSDWIHEIKFDGYRLQAHVDRGHVTIFTRGGLDWTKRFGSIATDLAALPVDRAIFDGELVVQSEGRTNFSELQADLAAGRKSRLQLYIFDLLFFDGFDLRRSPQIERKNLLEKLFAEAGDTGRLLYSQHLEAEHGEAMFKQACTLKWEGIVSKQKDAPYVCEWSKAWLKVKCAQEDRLPIVGFVQSDSGQTIASLHLARREGGDLVYAGKVGTGFTLQTARSIWQTLSEIKAPTAPLARKVRIAKAQWVNPIYHAAIEYRDITADGLLRHCSFKGLFGRAPGGERIKPGGRRHAPPEKREHCRQNHRERVAKLRAEEKGSVVRSVIAKDRRRH